MKQGIGWARRGAVVVAGAGLAAGLLGSYSASATPDGMATNPAAAGPSQNPYDPANGHPYRHGVVATRGQDAKMKAWAAGHGAGHGPRPTSASKTLSYGGGINGVGVTAGVPQVYIVFWGSQWGTQGSNSSGDLTFGNDSAGAAPYVQEMFKQLGTGGELWSGTMTQYCQGVPAGSTSCPSGYTRVGMPTNGVLAGVWYDGGAAQPVPSSANQLAQEAVSAASHFAGTTGFNLALAQFDIMSPPGAEPDGFNAPLNWCAWHDYTGDGYGLPASQGNIAFTNMPYVLDAGGSCGENFVNSGSAGTLDGFSIVNGHEYAETITDQFPAGGWTNHQGGSYNGYENGDECAWITPGTPGGAANVAMGTNSFAMQSTWSNDTNECDISHANVSSGPSTNTNTVTVTSPTGNQSTKVNTAVSIQASATDTGSGATITFSATGLPPGLTINSAGLISGKTGKKTGTYKTTVKATDNTGASGTSSFTWSITR